MPAPVNEDPKPDLNKSPVPELNLQIKETPVEKPTSVANTQVEKQASAMEASACPTRTEHRLDFHSKFQLIEHYGINPDTLNIQMFPEPENRFEQQTQSPYFAKIKVPAPPSPGADDSFHIWNEIKK